MPSTPPRQVQRVAAYALLRDGAGVTALVRGSSRSDLPGLWGLPGGGVEHGEHPERTVVRETREETGLEVEPTGVHDVVSDVTELPARGVSVHTVRIVYDVRAEAGVGWPGRLRPERDGTSDLAAAVSDSEAAGLALLPFAATMLGLPGGPASTGGGGTAGVAPPGGETGPGSVESGPGSVESGPASVESGPGSVESGPASVEARPPQVQRAGAYALVLEGDQVLLSRYAGDGRWSLPGGGIHFGEAPTEALEREVLEETGLPLAAPRLLGVDSVHFTGHSPSGRLEDFHAVRVVYSGSVPPGSHPTVLEVDGSADAAGWFPAAALDGLPVTRLVRTMLRLDG